MFFRISMVAMFLRFDERASFDAKAITTGRSFLRCALVAMHIGVSVIPRASFAKVLPVQGAITSASSFIAGPKGSAAGIVYGPITYTCDLSAYPTDNSCKLDGRIVLVEEDKLLVSPGGKQAKIEFGEVVWLICDEAYAYSVGQYVDYYFQNVIAPENEGEPLNIITTTVCIP